MLIFTPTATKEPWIKPKTHLVKHSISYRSQPETPEHVQAGRQKPKLPPIIEHAGAIATGEPALHKFVFFISLLLF